MLANYRDPKDRREKHKQSSEDTDEQKRRRCAFRTPQHRCRTGYAKDDEENAHVNRNGFPGNLHSIPLADFTRLRMIDEIRPSHQCAPFIRPKSQG
jgi:hypothetical protein